MVLDKWAQFSSVAQLCQTLCKGYVYTKKEKKSRHKPYCLPQNEFLSDHRPKCKM